MSRNTRRVLGALMVVAGVLLAGFSAIEPWPLGVLLAAALVVEGVVAWQVRRPYDHVRDGL